MKLSLKFLETRLQHLGSRCEPVTHKHDRDGYKPQGEFLNKAGLRLSAIDHSAGDATFKMVERSGEDSIAIREFSYSLRELEKGEKTLFDSLRSDQEGYATEWNWLQFKRAQMLLDMDDAVAAQTALMRDQASVAPVRLGGFDMALGKAGEAYVPDTNNGLDYGQ